MASRYEFECVCGKHYAMRPTQAVTTWRCDCGRQQELIIAEETLKTIWPAQQQPSKPSIEVIPMRRSA